MSEYLYYEFLAIDRPLDRQAQGRLRQLSSRARISATTFTNHYEWGDFRGDPLDLMTRWFDLHLFFANWRSRRLMIRVPVRFLRRADLNAFLRHVDWVEIRTAGDNVIVDICPDEVEPNGEWSDDGSGWLAALAPLRADVLSGDLRLFYLLWLAAVQYELVPDDEVEPLPGIGPLTGALEAFAEFFGINSDLVQAAAEVCADEPTMSKGDVRRALAGIPEEERIELLLRVMEGDAHVAADLANRIRGAASARVGGRTAHALRTRMQELEAAREQANVKRHEAERRRAAKIADKERRIRLDALRKRGDKVWQEIEVEVERRLPQGYERAMALLSDLQALAVEQGSQEDFDRRLASIRARHERKRTFVERLHELDRESSGSMA